MSAPKFTPGPWKVSESSRAPIIDADDQEIISACGCCDGISARSEDLYLLAAAPDLYAACKAVTALGDIDRPDSIELRVTVETMRMLRAALRKAEGGAT